MNATFPAPTAEVPVPEADHIFIGRDFYALSGNLPDGTPFQWGINLASLNRTETIAQAKLVADTFQGERAHLTANVNLDALEIGNEPDFYADGKKLGAAWTPANYSHTWLDYAQGVSEVIQLGGDGPYLTPGAMAGFETPVWTPEAFFEAGILGDDNIRAVVKQFNQHVYSGAFGDGYPLSPVGGLMDKGTVRTNLTTRANGLKAAKSEGLQYVFVSVLTTEWLHHTIQSEILADYGCSLKVIHMPSELKSQDVYGICRRLRTTAMVNLVPVTRRKEPFGPLTGCFNSLLWALSVCTSTTASASATISSSRSLPMRNTTMDSI